MVLSPLMMPAAVKAGKTSEEMQSLSSHSTSCLKKPKLKDKYKIIGCLKFYKYCLKFNIYFLSR